MMRPTLATVTPGGSTMPDPAPRSADAGPARAAATRSAGAAAPPNRHNRLMPVSPPPFRLLGMHTEGRIAAEDALSNRPRSTFGLERPGCLLALLALRRG